MSRVEGKGYADTGRSSDKGKQRKCHPDIILVPCPVAGLMDFASTKGSVCASEQNQRSADRRNGNIEGEIGRQRHREVVVQDTGVTTQIDREGLCCNYIPLPHVAWTCHLEIAC